MLILKLTTKNVKTSVFSILSVDAVRNANRYHTGRVREIIGNLVNQALFNNIYITLLYANRH